MIDEKELLEEILKWHMERDSPLGNAMRRRLCELIESCKLPIQPPTRIDAAIKALRNDKPRPSFLDRFNGYDLANLLAWAFGQEQWTDGGYANMIWTDEEFGLGEKK